MLPRDALNEPTAEALWKYSSRLYSAPLVRTACLQMQDEAGADISLIFLLLFAARYGLMLTPTNIGVISRHCEHWRVNVIEPLRRIRRYAKNKKDELPLACDIYESIKATELLAERRYQIFLVEALRHTTCEASLKSPAHTARLNLDAYETVLRSPREAVQVLLDASSRDL